ncbi:SHOCT domain-containing protein [Halococcus qingdaonensis]|uniref:SHOCT domain-containing protein n=1 Tax=Halococcus qingdaonensis TaxID=224402 RepID=UPI002116A97A|nr:SHOCT domain-containing protein [Halococcus qingdaonensis]
MAPSPSDPATAVVVPVSIIAFLFGIVQLGTGTLFGVLPILIGVVGLLYLAGGGERIGEWLDTRTTADTTADDASEDALTTLRQRYARGEIDHAEFERRLNELLETETVSDVASRNDERLVERSQ